MLYRVVNEQGAYQSAVAAHFPPRHTATADDIHRKLLLTAVPTETENHHAVRKQNDLCLLTTNHLTHYTLHYQLQGAQKDIAPTYASVAFLPLQATAFQRL